MAATAAANRLIVVSGASRGLGVGICRQTLALDPCAEVVIAARSLEQATAVRDELLTTVATTQRAHALQLDVTDDASCQAAATALDAMGPADRPISLVNNAGVAYDLPWFPAPWPAAAATETLAVNLYGAERLTRALLPRLLGSMDGRVVFISSGGGRINMRRMADAPRDQLLSENLTWPDIRTLGDTFTREYEEAAAAACATREAEAQLPFLSASGLWLQSYGFSKACLGAYCQLIARTHPTLLSVACSPGFVKTDMASTYTGESDLKSIDEGGQTPAWLAGCGDRSELQTAVFYNPDRSIVGWVAD